MVLQTKQTKQTLSRAMFYLVGTERLEYPKSCSGSPAILLRSDISWAKNVHATGHLAAFILTVEAPMPRIVRTSVALHVSISWRMPKSHVRNRQ